MITAVTQTSKSTARTGRQRAAAPIAHTLGMAALTAAYLGLVKNGWVWSCEVLLTTVAQTIPPRPRVAPKLKGQRLDGWETAVQLLNQS